MTTKEVRDKLEIGLKPDAPYRPTNLPESQKPHPPHPAGTAPEPEGDTRPDDQGAKPRSGDRER